MSEPGPGDVVIVSGPPGSGKTTIAARLTQGFDMAVHLETDWFYRSIKQGMIAPHRPEADVQNRAVMATITAAAAQYATAGYAVVWDGIVGPWMLDRIRPGLGRAGCDVHYLILRPDPDEAIARVATRDDTTDTTGAQVMHRHFAEIAGFVDHFVDARGPVDAVLQRCETTLTSGKARLVIGECLTQ